MTWVPFEFQLLSSFRLARCAAGTCAMHMETLFLLIFHSNFKCHEVYFFLSSFGKVSMNLHWKQPITMIKGRLLH